MRFVIFLLLTAGVAFSGGAFWMDLDAISRLWVILSALIVEYIAIRRLLL